MPAKAASARGREPARHAAPAPESPGAEGLAKGRLRWVRSPERAGSSGTTPLSGALRETDATSRRDPLGNQGPAQLRTRKRSGRGGWARARRPGAPRTPLGTRRHSSFAGSVNEASGRPICVGRARRGRGRREVVFPCTPSRVEVDAKAEAKSVPGRARAFPPPCESGESGSSGARRVARTGGVPLNKGVAGAGRRSEGLREHPAPRQRPGRATPGGSKRVRGGPRVDAPQPKAQGRTVPPAAFPKAGRCAPFTKGRRSHRSESEGDSRDSSRANATSP